MEIFVSRDGQQFGPYSLDDVNAYLASGQLSGDDVAWYEGAADWMPLRSIEGITTPRASAPPPPSPARSNPTISNPALHGLSMIGWCSLFFTPLWGAFLTRSNWLTLGRTKEAMQSLFFMGGCIAAIVVLTYLELKSTPTTGSKSDGSGFGVLLWLAWYFGDFKRQAKYVKEQCGDDYLKKGAAIPVLSGFVIMVVLMVLMFGSASPSAPPK